MHFLKLLYLLRLHFFMYRAKAVVKYEMLIRKLIRYKTPEVFIRYEKYIFVRKAFHYLKRIGGCDADIGAGFKLRARIDIAHHRQILILFPHILYGLRRCHMRHGAVSCDIRHQHLFVRIKYGRALSHKVHSGKYYYPVFKLFRHLGEIKGVSRMICYLLDLRPYVIMCQYDRVLFLFKFFYFLPDIHFFLLKSDFPYYPIILYM